MNHYIRVQPQSQPDLGVVAFDLAGYWRLILSLAYWHVVAVAADTGLGAPQRQSMVGIVPSHRLVKEWVPNSATAPPLTSCERLVPPPYVGECVVDLGPVD
jgi:hypothetical protein